MDTNYAPYIQRRTLLVEAVKRAHPQKKGIILLLAGFEIERYAFRQDSSFYYLTGLEEPAVALIIGERGLSELYVPRYGTVRTQWAPSLVDATSEQLQRYGITAMHHLGQACRGYSISHACLTSEYENLLAFLEQQVQRSEVIFVLYPPEVTEQTLILDRLLLSRPELKKALVDISPLVAALRRTKSQEELELIYDAVDCTMQAHEAAASRIEPDIYEFQIQAGVEFIFKESGGRAAFPSIVASGKNSTVLHYTRNDRLMREGDLVVVDVGAELDYYCADITRTYPVSGAFTPRQREVYEIVLEAQDYIAQHAQPGYWLSNKEHPEKSLNHLVRAFLKEKGYENYFNHGIGHFLGLDVHDVGSYMEPLKEGDVITIEPGIYIPQENIGIRIEDNYWITNEGAVCISEELPRDSYEIEDMMQQELEEE